MPLLFSIISPVVSATSGISFNVNDYTFIFDQQNLIKAMDCFNQTAYFCVIKTLYENRVLTVEEISLSNMTLVAAGSETYSKYVKCASPSETSTQQIWCSRVHQNAALTQSDTAGSKCHALGVISNGTVLFQFNLIFHINDNVVDSSVQEVNTSRFEVSSCTQNSITSFTYHDSSTSVYTAAYTSSVPLTDSTMQTSSLSSYFSLITATLSGDFVHHTSNNSETTDFMSSLETFSHLSTMPMDASTASRSPQIASTSILVDLFSDTTNYIENFVTSMTRQIVNSSLIDVLALTSTFNFVNDMTKSVALSENSHVKYTFNDALTIEKSSTVPVNFTSVNEFISVTPSTSPVSFTGASEHISLTPSTLPVSFTTANEFISATPSTSPVNLTAANEYISLTTSTLHVSFTTANEHISLTTSTLHVSFTTAKESIILTPLTVPVSFTTEIESFSPATSAVPVSFTAETEPISLTISTVTDSFTTAIKPINLATSTVTDSFTTAIKHINLATSTVTDSFTTAIKHINLATSTVTDSFTTAIKPINLATSTVTDSFTTAIKPINLATSTVTDSFTTAIKHINLATSTDSFTTAIKPINLATSTVTDIFTTAIKPINLATSTVTDFFTTAIKPINLATSTVTDIFTTAIKPINLATSTVTDIFTTAIKPINLATSTLTDSFTTAIKPINLATSTVTDIFTTAIKPINLATSTVTDIFTTAIKPINLATSTVTDIFTTAIKPINLATSTVTDSFITTKFITFSSLSSSVLSINSQTDVPTIAYEMNFTDFVTKSSFNITAEFSTRTKFSGIVEPTSSSIFTNSQDIESKHLTSSMDVAAELSHIRETSVNVDLDSIDSLSPANLAPTVYTQNTESASFNTSVIRVTAATTLAMEFMNTNLAVSAVPAASSLRNTETTSSNNLAIEVSTDFNTSVHLAMTNSEEILRGFSTTSVDMLHTVQTKLEDLLPTTLVRSVGILHSTHISSTEIPIIAPTMSIDILLKTSFTIADSLLVPSITVLDVLHTTERNVEDISTGSIKTLYILPTPSATSNNILPTASTSLVDILLTASVSPTDVPSMASSVPLDMLSTGSATTMDVSSASSDSSRDVFHATQTNLEDTLHSGLAQTSSIFLTFQATSEEILPSLKTRLADVLSSENTLKGASEMSIDIVLTSFNTTDDVILEPSTISATPTLVYLSYLDITTTSDIQTLLTASINVAPTVSSLTLDLLLQISTTSEHFFQLSSGSQEDVVSFDSTTLTPSSSTTYIPVDSADIDSSFLTDVSFIKDLTSVEHTTLSFYVFHSTSSSELVSTASITSNEYQATFSTINATSKSINTTSIAMLYPTTFLEPSQTTSTYYIKSTLVKETPELIRTTQQLSTYTFYDGTGPITSLSTNTFSTMLSEVTVAINLIPSSTTFIAHVHLDATVLSEVQSEQILTVSGASKSQSSQLTSYLSLTLDKSSTAALNTAAETMAKSLEPFYTYLENSSQSYARKSSIIYDSLALFSNSQPIVPPSRSTSMTYELPLSGSSFFESSARSVSISTSTDTVSTVSSTTGTTSNTTKVISDIPSYINTSEKNRIIGITFGVLGFAAVLIVLVFVVKKIRSVNRESRFRSEFDRASHYSC
ncbi:serine-rich adhesin for platelets-like isoform X1 [Biomphalaria glabrata]